MARMTVEEVYRGEKYDVMSATTADYLNNGRPVEYDERYIRHSSREEKILKLLCRNEENLTKNLSGRQKKIFNKFKD